MFVVVVGGGVVVVAVVAVVVAVVVVVVAVRELPVFANTNAHFSFVTINNSTSFCNHWLL